MPIVSKVVDRKKDKVLIESLTDQWCWLEPEWPKLAYITYITGHVPMFLAGCDVTDRDQPRFYDLTSF